VSAGTGASMSSTPSAGPEGVAPELLAAAVERVRRGGLLAYPTETLYGLGADARSAAALERLRAWKGRGEAQPISILATGVGGLEALGLRPGLGARRLLEALWPGPLTAVLPCTGGFAPGVARAEDGAVGVRCSPHPVAAGLARALEEAGAGPVTATSLNRHGEPPSARREQALGLCAGGGADEGGAGDGKVGGVEAGPGEVSHGEAGGGARPGGSAASPPALARAATLELGVPWLLAPAGLREPAGTASTVVDATGSEPRVLREGAIPRAAVEAAWAGRPRSGGRRGAA